MKKLDEINSKKLRMNKSILSHASLSHAKFLFRFIFFSDYSSWEVHSN